MQIRKQKSWIQKIQDEYQAEVKRLKRKKFLLKAKLMLTVVLPVFIVLLSIKVIKTFIRIKVRSLFAKPKEAACEREKDAACPCDTAAPAKPPKPVPVNMTPVEKEIIQLVPVAGTVPESK